MTTFAQEMNNRLKDIEARAKAVGSNMTQVCANTGIARATVERWAKRPSQSVTKLDELSAEVLRLERLASAATPEAKAE